MKVLDENVVRKGDTLVAAKWACPMDKSPLRIGHGAARLECPHCKRHFSADSGYIDFIQEDTYYWGEIPQDRMRAINDWARKKGYQSAISEFLPTFGDGYHRSLTEPSRTDWTVLVDLDQNCSILDVGSGWGRLTFPLAQSSSEVYSLEYVKERVEFQSIVLEQSGLTNVHLCRGSFLNLPFAPEALDIVIFNGAFEWIGLAGSNNENPSQMQLDVLRECHKILKPGGRLYIGIENRFGYNMFLGTIDHSGYRFTSLLPRRLADSFVRIRSRERAYRTTKANGYRTYTYGLHGYVNMLRKADFNDIRLYAIWPHYNIVRNILLLYPVTPKSVEGYFLDMIRSAHVYSTRLVLFHRVSRLLSKLGLMKYLYPCYAIVGVRSSS